MKSLPRISVVIPSYNQAPYLDQCLRSVCGQKYVNLEIIVMDGGSTDGSIEIFDRYKTRFAHFQSRKDGGQIAALNRGLFEISTGEILTWLNSDDYWEEDILDEICRAIDPTVGRSIICGRSRWVLEPTGQQFDHPHFGSRTHEQLVRFWYYGTIPQCSVFFHRDAMLRAGQLDKNEPLAFDYQYWLRLTSQRGSMIYFIDRVLSYYRQHEDAKTVSQHFQSHLDLERVSRLYWPPLLSSKGVIIRISYRWSNSLYKPQQQALVKRRAPALRKALGKKDILSVLRHLLWIAWCCPQDSIRGSVKLVKKYLGEIAPSACSPKLSFKRSLMQAIERQKSELLFPLPNSGFIIHPGAPEGSKTRLLVQSGLFRRKSTTIGFRSLLPDHRAFHVFLVCKLEDSNRSVCQFEKWELIPGNEIAVSFSFLNAQREAIHFVMETEMAPGAPNNFYASVLVRDLRLVD